MKWNPQRTCLGCRTEKDKSELIRIVRTPEGEIKVDPQGRMNGRGAYICPDPECLSAAIKRGAIARALKAPVPESLREELLKEIDHDGK